MLHVSDIHLSPTAFGLIDSVAFQFDVEAIIDTGDITDFGSVPESNFIDSIGDLGVPYLFIRGNHDSVLTQQAVAGQPNAVVLDNSATRVAGLDIVGIGDPRFIPDQSTDYDDAGDLVTGNGEELAEFIQTSTGPRTSRWCTIRPRPVRWSVRCPWCWPGTGTSRTSNGSRTP
ncbi:hypothetical protein BH20ACT5_BH20ACT5_08910 [soil metagenome]